METFETLFKHRSMILKSLKPIITKTGLDLVAAKDFKTTKLVPKYARRAFAPPSSKIIARRMNYDKLQSHTQSDDHASMCEYAVNNYLDIGYRVYPNGVGLKQVRNAFVDFLAEKDGQVVFGESLTKKTIQQAGTLEKKLQFTKFGKMCFVISNSVIDLPQITLRLQTIAEANDVFVYYDIGLGSRINKLIELRAYLFFIKSSKNLPRLSASVEKKSSLVKIILQFGDPLPRAIKEQELSETWRMAFLNYLISHNASFKIPAGRTTSNKGYLLNFRPRSSVHSKSTSRDLLSVRILGHKVEISTRTKAGSNIFKDRFFPLLLQKGIDKQVREFASLV